MAELSLGLIGCGHMGRELADAIGKRTDCRIVAVADPDPEAREQAAAAYGAQPYANYETLLSGEDLSAVIVATPSYLHKEVAVCAAEAGKHIFCEKPMALSVADCDAMIQAANEAGVKLMVGHVLRLMFPWWRIKQLASEEGMGTPLCVSIRRVAHWAGRGWRERRDLSGGPLFEVNVHELDYLRYLCGEVAQVSAYGGKLVHPEADYYDVYTINLRFRSGAVGQLHGGCTTAGHSYEGQVICPRGVLSFGPDWGSGAVQRPGGDPEPLSPTARSGPVGVDWELDSFVRWVAEGEPPVVTAQDGRAAVRLAEATCRSITEGRPVDLP